jgi:hypothetical protein
MQKKKFWNLLAKLAFLFSQNYSEYPQNSLESSKNLESPEKIYEISADPLNRLGVRKENIRTFYSGR